MHHMHPGQWCGPVAGLTRALLRGRGGTSSRNFLPLHVQVRSMVSIAARRPTLGSNTDKRLCEMRLKDMWAIADDMKRTIAEDMMALRVGSLPKSVAVEPRSPHRPRTAPTLTAALRRSASQPALRSQKEASSPPVLQLSSSKPHLSIVPPASPQVHLADGSPLVVRKAFAARPTSAASGSPQIVRAARSSKPMNRRPSPQEATFRKERVRAASPPVSPSPQLVRHASCGPAGSFYSSPRNRDSPHADWFEREDLSPRSGRFLPVRVYAAALSDLREAPPRHRTPPRGLPPGSPSDALWWAGPQLRESTPRCRTDVHVAASSEAHVDYIRGRGVMREEPAFSFEPNARPPAARSPTQTQTPAAAAAQSPYSSAASSPAQSPAQSPSQSPASSPASGAAHPPAAASEPVLQVETEPVLEVETEPVLQVETEPEQAQLRHEDNVPMRLTAQPEMSENPLDDVVAKAKSTKALNRTAGCDHLIADCEKTIRANRKEYGAP